MNALSQTAAFEIPCKILPQCDLIHVFDLVGPLWENFREQQIFITGGTGFFGKWLLETLLYANEQLDLGCRIVVLSRNPMVFAENNPHLSDPAIVSFVTGDVRDFIYPEGPFKFVIHAATDVVADTTSIDLFCSCVDGTKRVLDFARQAGCSHFLLVSSGAVYGRQPGHLAAIPESYTGAPDPLNTKSAYGEGKHCAEWLANAYGEEYRFGVKVARCFAFVGPHLPLDKHFAIGNFILDALTDKEMVIQGDGTPCRSYLYAADLAVWLWSILLRAPAGTAYNVGGDEAISIAEVAQRVKQLAGSDKEITIVTPRDSLKQVERYVPDVQKAEHELGLKTWIPLGEAIHRTLEWSKSV
ncbi:MAG: NAD(P)-dependent oxidoreductase [Chlorobium sp.]|nr:NAD(P)-dependent oxidoreductase [Chlorobium sp.]